MPSIISELLQNKIFIEKITDEINSNIIGTGGQSVYDSLDGCIQDATVSDFTSSQDDILFKDISCDNLECTIEFKLDGLAEISSVNSEGDDATESEIISKCNGSVTIVFPSNTLNILNIENIGEIIADIEVEEVSIDLLELNKTCNDNGEFM